MKGRIKQTTNMKRACNKCDFFYIFVTILSGIVEFSASVGFDRLAMPAPFKRWASYQASPPFAVCVPFQQFVSYHPCNFVEPEGTDCPQS